MTIVILVFSYFIASSSTCIRRRIHRLLIYASFAIYSEQSDMSFECQKLNERNSVVILQIRNLQKDCQVFKNYCFLFSASFNHPSTSQGEDEQTQQNRSAMFTLWNLIADLVETQDQKDHQQQQIVDFYGKSSMTILYEAWRTSSRRIITSMIELIVYLWKLIEKSEIQ